MPLSTTQLVTLGVAALLVFWMVGAYNRLVALRNAVTQAWAKIEDTLRQRAAAGEPLLAALREPLASEQGALDAMQAALAEAGKAATAMTAKPLAADHAAAWVAAEAALSAAAARVFALFEHDGSLRGAAGIAEPAAAWREASSRLGFARQLFNDEATAYNDAIALFPTRLLAPMFRFRATGRL